MSQQIRLWVDGAETEPMDEQEVRDQVVRGLIPSRMLARLERSSPTEWDLVGVVLAEADKARAGAWARDCTDPRDEWNRTRIPVIMGTLAIGVLGAVAILYLRISILDRVYYPSDDAAYVAATNYAAQELVGLTRIIERGSITDTGNEWSVTLRVDGLNVFGGPVRKDIKVLMTHSPSYGYRLDSVKQ